MTDNLVYDHKKNTNISKILYNIDKSVNMFTKRIDVYNSEADETLQKFWICIEKAKLLKKNKKRIQVAIFHKDNDLVTFMKSLDSKINETVKLTNTHIEHHGVSLELSDTFPPVLELDIDQQSFVFDNNNNKIDYYSIPNGSSISMYIELEGVYLDNMSDFKNWKVLQMKENIIIDLGVSLFNNPVFVSNNFTQVIANNSLPKSMDVQSAPVQSYRRPFNNTKAIKTEQVRTGPPTLSELTGALNSLKKVLITEDCNDNKNTNIEKTIPIINPLAGLNKVITRESRSMVDILREEYQNEHKNSIKNLLSCNNNIDIFDFKKTLKKYKKSFIKDKIGKKYSKLIHKIKLHTDLIT
jgi:hypothetical protein